MNEKDQKKNVKTLKDEPELEGKTNYPTQET